MAISSRRFLVALSVLAVIVAAIGAVVLVRAQGNATGLSAAEDDARTAITKTCQDGCS